MATGRKAKNRQTERRRAALMMKRILIHFRSQMDEKLRPQGVTTAQLQVLKAIRTEPGVSGAQLARLCYMTPQSAQALLKGLEDDGWIVRSKDRANERVLNASLTAEGERLIVTAEKAAKVIEARFWRGVPESSVEALNAVLERCLENLGPTTDLHGETEGVTVTKGIKTDGIKADKNKQRRNTGSSSVRHSR